LEYGYHIAGATLRFKPATAWTLYFDADYTGRVDEFEGYNDHDLLGGRVRAWWSDGRSRVRVAVRYRQRDYPRAFIFDKEVNPGTGLPNPNKGYDIVDVTARGEVPFFWGSTLYAETELRLQDAEDPRYTYDRLRSGAGLEWSF
jgi:hypothetical protein